MTRHRDEQGAATAELALSLPLLVAVTTGLVWLLAAGTAQLRTVDAARETARAVARGEPVAAAVARGQEVAPPGAHVAVSDGAEVRVVVSAELDGPGGLFDFLPAVPLRSEAVTLGEEGAP
jgi:hypothetical protein